MKIGRLRPKASFEQVRSLPGLKPVSVVTRLESRISIHSETILSKEPLKPNNSEDLKNLPYEKQCPLTEDLNDMLRRYEGPLAQDI